MVLPRVLPWDTADAMAGMRRSLQQCVTDPGLCYMSQAVDCKAGSYALDRDPQQPMKIFCLGVSFPL